MRAPSEPDGRAYAVAPEILRAEIASGSRLTVDIDPEADPGFASAVVSGELFSVLLRQRGLLVLHGSGVSKDGVAVGFVGDSGWGKSTLAASLVTRGWSLLTDDLLVVDGLDQTAGLPTAIPSHPSMRLSPEAADAVADQGQNQRGVAHERTTKRHVEWEEAFSTEPASLAHVFVLDPRPSEAHRAVRIPVREAMAQFLYHTRGQKVLSAADDRRAHFGQCASLARAVPASQLRRRFGLDGMDALCDLVEAEVESTSPGPTGS
ncbi:hypothetical protein [Rubrivirga sp.]|uniref:hypothetical protein n=1 Tax=Rubrivirga sp. TaxID=1885344 RepID=UPI003B518A73